MAKDLFGLSASTGALQAARQSMRLMNDIAAQSSLKAQMFEVSSARAFGADLAVTRLEAATVKQARGLPDFPPSATAFVSSMKPVMEAYEQSARQLKLQSSLDSMPGLKQVMAGIEGSARQLKLQSSFDSMPGLQAAIAAMTAQRNSLASAHAALRDNHALFRQGSEMLRAVREGVAAIQAVESARASSMDTVLRSIRLDQGRFNNIMENIAVEAMGDLVPVEARGFATAFEDAVLAQASAATAELALVSRAAGDATLLEEFSERLYQAVLARLPDGRLSSGSSIISIQNVIAIVMLLLTVATCYSAIEASKADLRNTREITSRQDEMNELLRSLLKEFPKQYTSSVPTMRLVDRDASVFQRPAKGAAVIAVVPEGVQVAVVDIWGRWVKVTYVDVVAEATRTGWVLKKYLE